MYIPKPFKVPDDEQVFSFIENNAFGSLISSSSGRLCSSQIPFLLSADKSLLLGHLGKHNPQHQDLDGEEVLVVLQGAHGYISPSWYSKPGVPTWNFETVHVYGKATTFNCPERLKVVVDSLTDKYESQFSEPWQANYSPSMLSAIVGFEIEISDIQCQFKLSQNRDAQDRRQVVEKLREQGEDALANAMERSAS
ncbi:MAG: FMN-binding negative transcriptional regulator [Cellvibrionaceae bacterium]|nr:FMN-binding negative transcriptional regulator [Cellvibrionaceae bacterium]